MTDQQAKTLTMSKRHVIKGKVQKVDGYRGCMSRMYSLAWIETAHAEADRLGFTAQQRRMLPPR